MRIPRIYFDAILRVNEQVSMSDATHHYLTRVLRLKVGAQLILFNGQGGEYRATLDSVSKRECVVTILSYSEVVKESPLRTHLGQVVSRGERMDFVVQKAVELGVTEITPLLSERCEVKLSPAREANRVEHWSRIAVSAAEQSGRTIVPKIHAIVHFKEWLAAQQGSLGIIADPYCARHLAEIKATPEAVALAVGPEGGFTSTEVELAQSFDFYTVNLGPRILRTETAALVMLAQVQGIWGDL